MLERFFKHSERPIITNSQEKMDKKLLRRIARGKLSPEDVEKVRRLAENMFADQMPTQDPSKIIDLEPSEWKVKD